MRDRDVPRRSSIEIPTRTVDTSGRTPLRATVPSQRFREGIKSGPPAPPPTLSRAPFAPEDSAGAEAFGWLHAQVAEHRSRLTGLRLRRRLRALCVMAALTPLLVILASRLVSRTDDIALVSYGIGVLLTTCIMMYLTFGCYSDRSADVSLPEDPPLVTCMVAVRDEIDVIERCVTSLLNSSYPNLEVIVVDDFSGDGTAELLDLLASVHGFKLIKLDQNQGKKRALTLAAGSASGDIFLFTDSDCIVSRYAVEQCVKALLADDRIGAVSGHARALNADASLLTRVQDTWYDGQFGIAKAAESVFGSVTCVSGPMAAFRREAIYNFLPAWSEDRFLGQEFKFATDRQLTAYVLGQHRIGRRLKQRYADSPFVRAIDYPEQNWRVEYVASARVLTNVPESTRSLLKQQVRWKKSFIRNLCFTGSFIWTRGPVPAFLFYGHVLWVCAAPILAFRHLLWLPLHGDLLGSLLYLAGVLLKGCVWALAFRAQNPDSTRWLYRPLMSLISALCLSWILPYSALTLRKSIWVRG